MTDNSAGQRAPQGDPEPAWADTGRAAREALAQTWDGLIEVTSELSGTEWALPTECPGWDVQDQLSHVIAVERTIMGEPTPEWDGPLGDHVKNDFAAANERWIAVRRALGGPDVRAELIEVTRTRLEQLDALDADGWAAVGWSPIGQVPRAQFMEVRVFDCWVHEQDVRRALDRPGGSGNRASALSIDRVVGAMGFVVGKKAQSPDGTAVRFDVAGPADDARAFTIAVEGGRARPVGDEVSPTVTLSMSGLDFVRLGCGRATGAEVEAAGGIGLDGDAAVASRVLDAMNFMF